MLFVSPILSQAAEKPVETVSEASAAISHYIGKGCGAVIVTLGDKGCVYRTVTMDEAAHIPCEKVKAVDATVSLS